MTFVDKGLVALKVSKICQCNYTSIISLWKDDGFLFEKNTLNSFYTMMPFDKSVEIGSVVKKIIKIFS